jgi:hypothetical protein
MNGSVVGSVSSDAGVPGGRKRRYTFILDSGEQRTFEDPDAGCDWYANEADPSDLLVEIDVKDAD